MHDPRLVPGAATSYKMDATPGRHTQIGAWILELSGGVPGLCRQPQPPHHYPGKGRVEMTMHNYFHAAQAAGMLQGSVWFVSSSITGTSDGGATSIQRRAGARPYDLLVVAQSPTVATSATPGTVCSSYFRNQSCRLRSSARSCCPVRSTRA